MAVKSLYFKNAAPAGASGTLSLQDGGTAPTGALTTTGWTVAKLAATNLSAMLCGTKRASNTFAAADAIGSFAASACFRSEDRINGTFANTNWTLAFRIRASVVSSQTGSIKVRIWKSVNADGSGATQLTAAVLTGTTTAVLSTTVSATSTVTWTPGATVILAGEYIWVQCEWNIVATAGSNTADAVIYVESAGVITTPDFVLGAITGTLAKTEDPDTTSFAGTVIDTINSGTFAAIEDNTEDATFAGVNQSDRYAALAVTENTIPLTADSTLYTADSTLITADQVSIAGSGDAAVFAGDVATGPAPNLGTLAATETADTPSFAGLVGRSGVLAATEGVADTAAFVGTVTWFGTLAVTEGADTATFAGQARWLATLAVTEGSDTAAFAGLVGRSGVLAATEAADVAAFAGTARMDAVLAATEAVDTAAFTGSVLVAGALAATEGADTAAFAGGPVIAGTLAATEAGSDIADFHAVLTNSGVLSAVETDKDVAAFSGSAFTAATLAATEARDTAAIAGYRSLVDEKVGILNAFESGYSGGDPVTADTTLVTADSTFFTADMEAKGGDVANFVGGPVVVGVLAASEDNPNTYLPTADATIVTADSTLYTADSDRYGADTANFNGEVLVSGMFAATEDADVASFDGTSATTCILLATETGADQAHFIGGIGLPAFGVLGAVEGSDTAYFAMARWEDAEAGNGLRNEVQRTIWLTGHRRVTWLENEVEDTFWQENLTPEVISLIAEQERITRLGA